MTALLTLTRVAKLYGQRLIFKDVCQSFVRGSLTLLVGDNGSGKSTLMRIMAGLAQPSAGEVQLADDATVGYVAHATFLYPGLTAMENLTFWCRAYGLATQERDIMDALEHVGLAAHAHERAGVFSRGMAQKLNLARVLLQKPGLLLLDEPGTGLDQTAMVLLRDEMRNVRDRGGCVVCISHDLQGDVPLADTVCRMHKGRLTAMSPQEFAACCA